MEKKENDLWSQIELYSASESWHGYLLSPLPLKFFLTKLSFFISKIRTLITLFVVFLYESQVILFIKKCNLISGIIFYWCLQQAFIEWLVSFKHYSNRWNRSHSLLQGIFPTQGSNLGVLHCRWFLYQLSHQESPRITEWVAYPFSSRSSQLGIKPGSPALQADSFPAELPGKPRYTLLNKVDKGPS